MKPPVKRRTRADIKPKPVTASYLRSVAMRYLSERSASGAMLKQLLKRRSLRRLQVQRLEAETLTLIETVLVEMVEHGFVNDMAYAKGRLGTLERKGLPKRRIVAGLRQKGLDETVISTAMSTDIDELAQARRFAERKRLGPWRMRETNRDSREKDLRSLTRAGFSFRVASAALADPAED